MPNDPHHLPVVALGGGSIAELAEHLPVAPDEPEHLVQVGDLAKETGKTVRALHLYEELGLLKPHARSKGRYRLYGPDALVRVRWIGKLQEMGLSLAEVSELVREWETSDTAPLAMEKVRRVLEARLRQAREQMARLRDLEHELIDSLKYLDVCNGCDPVRVHSQCRDCDLHSCGGAPDLVAGVQANG
jgi:MerR family transcriptional regulator, copper efflux regulator